MEEILRCDFHTHTKYSPEPKLWGIIDNKVRYDEKELIKTAKDNKLDVIAVTEHNSILGAELAEKYIKKNKIEDITVIKGEEISSKQGHIIGLGIEELIKPKLSAQETIDEIKKQGGIVIIPHPYSFLYALKNHLFKLRGIDGIEVFNPFTIIQPGSHKKAMAAQKKKMLAPISSSDAHTLCILGKVYTEIKSKNDVDSILKSIKQKKTTPCWNIGYLSGLKVTAKNVLLCLM